VDGEIVSSFEVDLRGLTLSKFAPALFVLLWSTGFVGAKYGLPYADPFIFLSVRILIAAFILFVIALVMKLPIAIGTSAIRRSSLIGFFLHACYLGGVFYSISKGLPAGVAAVVTSLQPVLVSLLAVKILGEQLKAQQVVGLVIGLIGVVLVLGPTFDEDIPVSSGIGILVALIGSTTATLLQKKIGADVPLISGTAYQYLASGLILSNSRYCNWWDSHSVERTIHCCFCVVNCRFIGRSYFVIALVAQHWQRSIGFFLVLLDSTGYRSRSVPSIR
jgi:drug/metabolite transporter (DMT)-like permease